MSKQSRCHAGVNLYRATALAPGIRWKTPYLFPDGYCTEEGYLDITRPTSDYLGTGWTSAPLAKEQLITVTQPADHDLRSWRSHRRSVLHATSCLQYEADAGTRWAYHNAPYTLLDTVIESAIRTEFQHVTSTPVSGTGSV